MNNKVLTPVSSATFQLKVSDTTNLSLELLNYFGGKVKSSGIDPGDFVAVRNVIREEAKELQYMLVAADKDWGEYFSARLKYEHQYALYKHSSQLEEGLYYRYITDAEKELAGPKDKVRTSFKKVFENIFDGRKLEYMTAELEKDLERFLFTVEIDPRSRKVVDCVRNSYVKNSNYFIETEYVIKKLKAELLMLKHNEVYNNLGFNKLCRYIQEGIAPRKKGMGRMLDKFKNIFRKPKPATTVLHESVKASEIRTVRFKHKIKVEPAKLPKMKIKWW
ncbi:MAG: hypothetical protein ABIH00_11370 [Armatimonadota bacterium]